MPGKWNETHNDSLKRDLLRDFCLAAACLEEQFERFEASGALSFSIISAVMGRENNKGLLWRVKDTAHHLFKACGEVSHSGQQLDWTIGFLFHECLQLLEAAYQLQYYGPKLAALSGDGNACGMPEKLFELSEKCRGTLFLHITRARELVAAACELFCRYLAGECANRPLARLVYDREELLRRVFGPLFQHLLNNVYGRQRERAFLEAAISLAEIGHTDQAALALNKALELNPGSSEAIRLLSGFAE